jgi:DNA-binding GntR family transcriptional regulator
LTSAAECIILGLSTVNNWRLFRSESLGGHQPLLRFLTARESPPLVVAQALKAGNMRVQRVSRESLRDAIVKVIEDALLSGELQPGDRIIEADLAQQAGVSRGPVREAVRQLVGEGILVNYPSRGTFVTRWTPDAVTEAYSLRAALEQLAIRQVVEHATPEDVARLQAIVDQMDSTARAGDAQALTRLAVDFHQQLYALSQHSLLQRTLSQLRRQLYCLLAMDRCFSIAPIRVVEDHRAIVEALRMGDAASAEAAITAHVLSAGAEVAEQVREILQDHDDVAGPS